MNRRPMAYQPVDPHTAPMPLAEKVGTVLCAILLVLALLAACLFLPDRLA